MSRIYFYEEISNIYPHNEFKCIFLLLFYISYECKFNISRFSNFTKIFIFQNFILSQHINLSNYIDNQD